MTTFVVGLTGGIGSGKSAAADLFARFGAAVVDSDLIARALTVAGGEAMPDIQLAFGVGVLAADGALDRAAMRRLVFADASARARLEAILHPMIRRHVDRALVAAAQAVYTILVVPLLVETGAWRSRCDRVAVVDCPEEMQLARVMRRNGLAAEEVRAIMAAQADRAARLAAADDVIDNAGDFDSLRTRVEMLHAGYVAMAEKKAADGVL